MIDKICVKAAGFQLLLGKIFGQLVNNGANDLKMAQFLSTCRGGAMEERVQNPCAARVWVVERRRNGECTKNGVAV